MRSGTVKASQLGDDWTAEHHLGVADATPSSDRSDHMTTGNIQPQTVEVPFHGEAIEALRDPATGIIYASIRRICENLGVAFSAQLQKLKSYHWATVSIIDTVAQDKKLRELALLPVSQVPMWLSHIHPNKLNDPAKAHKLKQYQLEAVDVLYKHFLEPHVGTQPTNGAGQTQDPILAAGQSIIALRQQQLALEGKVGDLAVNQQMVEADLREANRKLDDLYDLQRAALDFVDELPRSDQPAAPLTTRDKINMLVRGWCFAHRIDYADGWRKLYHQFTYRYHFNVRHWSEQWGLSKIDVIERVGRLEELYALATELFT
jgi:hypothetical protein